MPTKEFYIEIPLYKKFEVLSHEAIEPAFLAFCETCNSNQTFIPVTRIKWPPVLINVTNPPSEPQINRIALPFQSEFPTKSHNSISPDDQIQKISFTCASCNKYERTFLLRFNDEMTSVEKIGQFPRWSTEISKPLRNILGDYRDIYKKGLDCESESYGIGAFAYYRRIVEVIIGKLLETLKESLSEEEKAIYLAALEATQKTIVAKEKIEIVKDMLPDFLRQDNFNPLGTLHEILSEGIHELSEEDCLDYAKLIRKILEFLVDQIENHKNIQKELKESMKNLLDKRNKKLMK